MRQRTGTEGRRNARQSAIVAVIGVHTIDSNTVLGPGGADREAARPDLYAAGYLDDGHCLETDFWLRLEA